MATAADEEKMELWDVETNHGKQVAAAPSITAAVDMVIVYLAELHQTETESIEITSASKKYDQIHHLCVFGYHG